jgi:putative membrane protein
MPHPYYFDHGSFWWVGGLFGLLVVIAIVVGVFLVIRELQHRPAHLPPPMPPPPVSRAVEELDLRYARGEIDRAEYLQRRADLGGPGSGMPPPPPAP